VNKNYKLYLMKLIPIKINLIMALLLLTAAISAQTTAFPGAEGAGMFTTGGRGGKVLYVTSLDDSEEPGTLRWAIREKGARTILFKVSGEIQLKSPLKINNGDLTIAGQSAPGDGICISDHETVISADNVILRFLRFRLGDKAGQAVDALSGKEHENIIIDHCSMSWGVDELSSFYDNKNFTMQWCFITESLRNSVHPKGKHGYGGIWGGQHVSFHHNLLAHNDSRNPRFCGSRYSNQPDLERVDFRNNVIYNWGSNNIYAGEGGQYNLVANYFKPGPASASSARKRILNPDADNGQNNQPAGIYGHFYLVGNILEGNEEVSSDNTLGVEMGNTFAQYAPQVKLKDIIASEPFPMALVSTDKAANAYEKVLRNGGCSLVRDIHDERYVEDVKAGSYTFEGSAGSSRGLIDSQEDVGGWPEYRTYNEYIDSDKDGIPDGWLEKNHPGKKANDRNEEGYTYLELYLHSLVAHLMGNEQDETAENRQMQPTAVRGIIVDRQGGGDFRTLQEAIDAVRAFDPDYTTHIFVKKGIYYEKVVIPDYVRNLKITGESREKTILTNNDHAMKNGMGTFNTYTLQIRGEGITLENLTIENNAPMVAQAVALHTEGDRIILKNCRLLGNQDTLYTGREKGKLYFHDCYIEGTTDFIFGPSTAWFEACELHGKKNSYLTAASTPPDAAFGYIFNRCNITVAENVTSLYLGRPWRPYAMTLFMRCSLPAAINPLGWDNWGNPDNEHTARYSEYGNSGEGSSTTGRVPWSSQLTPDEAEQITLQQVMGDFYPMIVATTQGA
jgi:pectin methylesterase-like acyl-CoA thioesterase/pectate lyase